MESRRDILRRAIEDLKDILEVESLDLYLLTIEEMQTLAARLYHNLQGLKIRKSDFFDSC